MAWMLAEPPKAESDSYTFKDWIEQLWKYIKFSSGVVSVTTDYQAKMTDTFILVDATAGNRIITLPFATGNLGKQFIIKKNDASGNTVTAIRRNTETIDGATNVVTATKTTVIRVVSDNSNWFLW